jgi:hypothetical protein
MDSIRRTMLKTGAAATALAAAPGMLAQQAGQAATSFYENGRSAFILCGAPNTFLPPSASASSC